MHQVKIVCVSSRFLLVLTVNISEHFGGCTAIVFLLPYLSELLQTLGNLKAVALGVQAAVVQGRAPG